MVKKDTSSKKEESHNISYLSFLIEWITSNSNQKEQKITAANPRQQLLYSRQLKRKNRRSSSTALPECEDSNALCRELSDTPLS